MSKLIKTQNGSFVSISEIISVHNLGEEACSITTRNGETYPVDESSTNIADLIEREDPIVIPASPGYSVVRDVVSEKYGEWHYELLPVVGWIKLPSEDCVELTRPVYDRIARSTPIVAGYVRDTISWNLVLPDGRVIDAVHNVHNNIQEWLDAEMANRTGSKKRKNSSRK